MQTQLHFFFCTIVAVVALVEHKLTNLPWSSLANNIQSGHYRGAIVSIVLRTSGRSYGAYHRKQCKHQRQPSASKEMNCAKLKTPRLMLRNTSNVIRLARKALLSFHFIRRIALERWSLHSRLRGTEATRNGTNRMRCNCWRASFWTVREKCTFYAN